MIFVYLVIISNPKKIYIYFWFVFFYHLCRFVKLEVQSHFIKRHSFVIFFLQNDMGILMLCFCTLTSGNMCQKISRQNTMNRDD